MKVSLLALHDGINYGEYWQVYALDKYFESLGHEFVLEESSKSNKK